MSVFQTRGTKRSEATRRPNLVPLAPGNLHAARLNAPRVRHANDSLLLLPFKMNTLLWYSSTDKILQTILHGKQNPNSM